MYLLPANARNMFVSWLNAIESNKPAYTALIQSLINNTPLPPQLKAQIQALVEESQSWLDLAEDDAKTTMENARFSDNPEDYRRAQEAINEVDNSQKQLWSAKFALAVITLQSELYYRKKTNRKLCPWTPSNHC